MATKNKIDKPNLDISIDEMYKQQKKYNDGWGVEGYEAPRLYPDARKLARIKLLGMLKAGKYLKPPDRYFCKKGHFLDRMFKTQTVMVKDKKQVY
jgi:hypothetical protein